jgi:S-adenosylmethionine:tRNA ribosyltransferase-isomerase
MKLSELSFKLPETLIAQHPAHPADQARMMILNRKNQTISEDIFFNLDKHLNKGDVLVFNNSKVLPARLIGNKITGGGVETLLSKQLSNNQWEA